MNLKFERVDWDKDLMYVEFGSNGQTLRWYPKWKEVDDILHSAWLTEGAFNNGQWRDYFDIICTEVIVRELLRRVARTSSSLCEADVTASQLFRSLRNIFLIEG